MGGGPAHTGPQPPALHLHGGPSGSKAPTLRSAKWAPQNAIAAPRHNAASPASTPAVVGIGLGAEAAWPALTSTSTPTAIRNCCIRCGIWPDTALCISVAVK